MTQKRFVFGDLQRDGNRLLYDTRRGRTEAIGKLDEGYVSLFESLFALGAQFSQDARAEKAISDLLEGRLKMREPVSS